MMDCWLSDLESLGWKLLDHWKITNLRRFEYYGDKTNSDIQH